jgi:hypothetical protein
MRIDKLSMDTNLPTLLLTYHGSTKQSLYSRISVRNALRKAPEVPKKIYVSLSNGQKLLIWTSKKGLIHF